MLIKTSFMHYMKWISVMLAVVVEEFELVWVFLLFFSFHCRCHLVKRSTLAEISWGCSYFYFIWKIFETPV